MLKLHLLKAMTEVMAKRMIIYKDHSIFKFSADCESSFTL